MSWDVIIFAPKADVDTRKVREAFHQMLAGKRIQWSATFDFERLTRYVEQEYPITEQGQAGSPWLKGSMQGEGFLFLKVIYSRINEVKSLLEQIKGIENLIIFDIGKDTITQGGKAIAEKETVSDRPSLFLRRWFSRAN